MTDPSHGTAGGDAPGERAHLRSKDLFALSVLAACVAQGKGWKRRSVRGWMFYDEVQARTDGTSLDEVLPRLARLGLVEREDVRPPARQRPVWLYRITAEGMRRVSQSDWFPAAAPVPPPRPAPAGEETIYVPRRPWSALEKLQARARGGEGPERFGARGWTTHAEVRQAGAYVEIEDMEWLIRHGLAERRRSPAAPGGGFGPAWLYRPTPLGLAATVADVASDQRVQLRLTPLAGAEGE